MARLNRVEITGYKSINKLDITLGNLNVLIGANGAGKSNFASFFRMLNFMMSKRLQLFIGKTGGAESVLFFGTKHTSELSGKLHFETEYGSNIYEMKLTSGAGDTLIFENEEISYTRKGTGQAPMISLGSGHKESILVTEDLDRVAQPTTAKAIRAMMTKWRFYQFHDTSEASYLKKYAKLEDNRYLRDDAGNLSAYLHMLQNKFPKHYARIRDCIRLVAPFFDDFVLEPTELNEELIMLQWRHWDSDMVFNSSQLSDGTLRMMALITLLLQPEPPDLVIIDEPELGLHPYAIKILVSLLREVSSKCQIIISTQSVTLVNELDADELIVVDRKDRQSLFKRLEPDALESWLNSYSLGELWEKNVLGGRPS